MTEENEPSMEDILASIRNILAEDNKKGNRLHTQPENVPEQFSDSMPSYPEMKRQALSTYLDTEPDLISKNHLSSSVGAAQDPSFIENHKPLSDESMPDDQESIVNLTPDMIVPAVPTYEAVPVVNQTQDQYPTGKQTAFVATRSGKEQNTENVVVQKTTKEEVRTDQNEEERQYLDDEDSLLAEPTLVAARQSLSHLRDIASGKRLGLGNSELTIEMLVRETIKPYLKEWLDINLPAIVERIVKKEVAHVMDRLDLK